MMLRVLYIRAYALSALVILIATALCMQFVHGLLMSTLSPGVYIEQFFSYFTILSNIFVAIVFSREAIAKLRDKPLSPHFSSLRGAAVFCILTTGMVYTFFLRGPAGQGGVENSIPWINAVFHYWIPSLAVLDWLVFPPKDRVNWSTLFSWFGIAIVYEILVEIGGLLSGAYPYFFLDPTGMRSYVGLLYASAAFLPFFLVFGLFVLGTLHLQLWVQRLLSRKMHT